jgi:GNAT superfamily N-acetyltransferase
MTIRKAITEDHISICNLLTDLGYQNSNGFIAGKLEKIQQQESAAVYVYELDDKPIGFIAIDITLQLGLAGDIMRINYLAVDPAFRSQGIGKSLLEYVTYIAQQKGCDRIEVHCHSRRTQAHTFYERDGFIESPKYFIKPIKQPNS